MVECLENGIIPNVIPDDGKDGYEIEIEYQENEIDLASTNSEELSKAIHAGQIPDAYKEAIESIEAKDVRRLVSDEPSETKKEESIYGSEEEMLARAKEGYFVRNPERNLVYCPAGEVLRQKCIKQNGSIRYANKNACRHCKNRDKCYKGKNEWKEIDFTKDKLEKPCKEWLKAEGKEVVIKKKKRNGHFEMKKIVDQCPALKKRIKPVMSVKRLVYQPTNSFYQVLSAEAYTKHGLNVHAVIFDELHSQPNRELFDVMTKGSGDARTQPLFFLITTAGTDRHSVYFEQHQKAEDIILGRKIDYTFYPVIYGASDEEDWTSESVWYQANPSLGHTIDITAFVLVFPPRDDAEKYVILPYFWIPEENMRLRVRRDHVPYDVWEKQGCLMTTEGNVIHYGFIENFIEELGKKFHIREIAFDRWGAVQMVQNLEGLEFTVVPFGQGFKDMSPPSKRLMELVLEKKLAHGGHPVLALDRAIRRKENKSSIYDERRILILG